jgi:RNA polymerase sigma-70 factor, ECF subfamily
MVRLRLDRRLRQRLDVSDVLQDVQLEAGRRLPEYCADPPMPFLVWIRFLTAQKIIEAHRRHLGAAARDVRIEANFDRPGADSSTVAGCLARSVTSPSEAAMRGEHRELIQRALEEIASADREVLLMRHFERMSNAEVAAELSIETSTASKRYLRALARLRSNLAPLQPEQ